MAKTLGYLVTVVGSPGRYTASGALWVAGARHAATIFPSRRAADAAIKSTMDYSARHALGWDREDYRTVRCEMAR